ncbi:hypothetical protein SEA_SONALI_79 [Arthrobacter phage Sonali]|uniref:Uncharacterized protein n=1 Tax=Arthrobacter phage Sonali TaxID=2510495 RepID=A0A411CQJ2_9CAUD|nr:hypothetical protein HOV09_gp79 [Arthrobacter phage Sonali]QAY16191.1 hypothetical protein SEA_SONALI_79 [Arthrobacter phage Sonali]
MNADIATRCRRMPRGWYCSLQSGHDGPCPGWPTRWTRLKYWLRGNPLPF